MSEDGCPKCHGRLVRINAVWHPVVRFSRIPAGTVDIDYTCVGCGHVWHESHELQDPVAITDPQQKGV